jgi:hypothetical protein
MKPSAPAKAAAHKLRWIGEDEAKQLERELRAGPASDCVLAAFVDTD